MKSPARAAFLRLVELDLADKGTFPARAAFLWLEDFDKFPASAAFLWFEVGDLADT